MTTPKLSHLDLQCILSPKAMQAKEIQKTLIFVNIVAEIQPIIETIQK